MSTRHVATLDDVVGPGWRRETVESARSRGDVGMTRLLTVYASCFDGWACHRCGKVGLDPVVFVREGTGTSHVFAVCRSCGAWREF